MFPCQLKIVQDNNKRLQEYNASLQLYNSNLQADALQNGETISRLQNEKSAIMENLSGLRDHINSLKSQLDSSRVSLIIVFLFFMHLMWNFIFVVQMNLGVCLLGCIILLAATSCLHACVHVCVSFGIRMGSL